MFLFRVILLLFDCIFSHHSNISYTGEGHLLPMVHTFSVSSASISWNFLVSRAISINCKLFTAGVFLILVSDYVPPRACIHETWEELSGLKREQRLPDSLLSVLGDFNRANLTNELSNYTQHTTTCPPGKTGDLITVLISSKASSLRL